ncbi:hypothetical protein WN944_006877 [Citrus x changshan-huyou]|uniref:Uncharacterized protein n=1 Tax=Citrus x changshan-huyou TaxID=2935761 RepID=A0AAP0QXJ7_9ROSI
MTMGIMVREDENCGPQPGWRIRHFPIKNLEMVGPEHRFSILCRSPRMVCQTDEMSAHPRIPVMVNMASASVSSYKNQNLQDSSIYLSSSLDQLIAAGRHSVMMDEYSEEDEEFQLAESEQAVTVASGLPDSENRKSGFGAPWKGLDSEILKLGSLGGVGVGGDCRTT